MSVDLTKKLYVVFCNGRPHVVFDNKIEAHTYAQNIFASNSGVEVVAYLPVTTEIKDELDGSLE